jgi:hypothetical protein
MSKKPQEYKNYCEKCGSYKMDELFTSTLITNEVYHRYWCVSCNYHGEYKIDIDSLNKAYKEERIKPKKLHTSDFCPYSYYDDDKSTDGLFCKFTDNFATWEDPKCSKLKTNCGLFNKYRNNYYNKANNNYKRILK